MDCFSSRYPPYQFGDGEPITVGSMVDIITLRRKLADGTARPNEIAEFERIATQRASDMDTSANKAIDAVIKPATCPCWRRDVRHPLSDSGGYSRQRPWRYDFNPNNAMMVAGGLKGAVLPENCRKIVLETFNVPEERLYHAYSMREINATFPLCHAGRYHISPWVIMLPLDTPGEQLLDTEAARSRRGQRFSTCRSKAAGVVSSAATDQRRLCACACGHQGPTVGRKSCGTPTCRAATRSVRGSPSTPTCGGSHDRPYRRRSSSRARWLKARPYVTVARSGRRLRHPRNRSRALIRRARNCRRCSTSSSPRSSISWSRPVSACSGPKSLHAGVLELSPPPIRCHDEWSRTFTAAPLLARRGPGKRRVELRHREALDGWVTRVDKHGNKGDPGVSHRGWCTCWRAMPRRMCRVDRAGRACQGDQSIQDALERPIHHGCGAAHHGGNRCESPGGAVDVGGLLARRRHAIERTIFRPQYFDKIVAWGGGEAITNVIKYLGPGIQLISFDPKSSISMIGREAFDSETARRGRRTSRRRHHGVQPGGLPGQPLRVRRRAKISKAADRIVVRRAGAAAGHGP